MFRESEKPEILTDENDKISYKGLKAHRNIYLLYVWQHKFELHHKSKNKTFYARVYKLIKKSSFLVPKKCIYLLALAFELIYFNLCSVIKIFAAKQMG